VVQGEKSRRLVGLIGREAELRTLDGVLAAAAAGNGSTIVIGGPAGIGKSRLLAETEARARARGMTVLGARATEPERGFAFGVVRGLFEPALVALDDHGRETALAGAAVLASDLFSLGPTDAPPRAPFSAYHGLYWLAANLSRQAPLLIAVDDLPACDELSLSFLTVLARRLEGLRVAILATARSETRGATPSSLDELLDTGAVKVLELEGLGEAEAECLASALLDRAQVNAAPALASLAHGNPLYLEEIASAIGTASEGGGPLDPAAIADLGPRIVARTTALRLGRCGPDAVALGRALSVLGDGAPLGRARQLAELDPARATEALAGLAAAGVVRGGGEIGFAHPLVGTAIYEQIEPATRGALHRRAAFLLEQEGAAVEAIAAQLMVAPAEADAATVRTLRAAARIALRQGASGAAVGYLTRALAEPPGPERCEVLLALGEAEVAGDPDLAIEHLGEALELAAPALRGGAVRALARAQAARGQRREAAETIEAELTAHRERDPDESARLLADCVAMGIFEPGLRGRILGRLDEWLGERPAGTTAGERALLAQAALRSAQEARTSDATLGLADRAWGRGALLADEGPDGPSWLLLIWSLILAQALPEAEQRLGEVIEECRRTGAQMAFATASYFRAETRLRLGRLVDAQADCEAALAMRELGWERYAAAARAARGRLLIERGLLEEAAAELDSIDEAGLGGSMDLSWVLLARARLATARRENAVALTLALEAGERLTSEFGIRHTVLPWRPVAATAAVGCGRVEVAAELIAEEEAIASQAELPVSIGRALRLRGRLTGELEPLERAAEAFKRASAALERAAALADLGAALRREGQRVRSREVLRQALDLARCCDARLLAASLREELAASGARLRREAFSGVDALTPSERRVAGLATEGMTNPEIAQSLFVTTKTVEFHLANAYRKLGIRRRQEIAAALADAAT
jgi:DNA-binding CsgD family transcriptional regulator